MSIGTLQIDSGAIALAQQRFRVAAQEQVGHQIFEHRPVPGNQRQAGCTLGDGAAQEEPVFGRYIALGDREKARQPGLAGQQIVMMGIDPVGRGIISDMKQSAAFIEQHAEFHAMRPSPGPFGNGFQMLLQLPMRLCRVI